MCIRDSPLRVWLDAQRTQRSHHQMCIRDRETLGIVAADVTGMVTFADALETFLVANRGYLSKMRSDL